ncbi:MAG: hypothetical protein HC852_14240, partial [Acaryochloridaceae cyanobacterium RU_4_10]|nr:hypothetical protein [Acaryochloridaceae cyanobacterium RU_4_10]
LLPEREQPTQVLPDRSHLFDAVAQLLSEWATQAPLLVLLDDIQWIDEAEMPVVIAFTVKTDGQWPTEQSSQDAIAQVDTVTGTAPAYYTINCAHPTHFANILVPDETWVERIHGLRANASTKSHAELNESETLDEGNPTELGNQYRELRHKFPQIDVLGGCCGTDDRHIEAICKACLPVAWLYLSHQTFSMLG